MFISPPLIIIHISYYVKHVSGRSQTAKQPNSTTLNAHIIFIHKCLLYIIMYLYAMLDIIKCVKNMLALRIWHLNIPGRVHPYVYFPFALIILLLFLFLHHICHLGATGRTNSTLATLLHSCKPRMNWPMDGN